MPQAPEQTVDHATRLQHLTDWQKSGLSKSAYGAQHSITVNQLTYWRKLEQSRKARSKPAFVKANIVDDQPKSLSREPAQVARLIVGSTAVLEISTMIDPTWAARLIAAVGGRS